MAISSLRSQISYFHQASIDSLRAERKHAKPLDISIEKTNPTVA